MMMKMYSLLICLLTVLCVLLVCCKDENTSGCRYSDFIYKETLFKKDSIRVPPVLLKENKIIITDNLLISQSVYRDTIFRVFKLPSCRFLGLFGLKGQGPDELSYVNISGFRSYGKYCQIKDAKKVMLIDFPDKDTVTYSNISIIKRYSIPGALIPFNDVFILNDSIICGKNRNYSEKEVTFYNILSGKIGSFIDYPDLYPATPGNLLWQLYSKQMAVSNDRQKIAMLYRTFPMLRIYNTNDRTIKGTYIKEKLKQKALHFNRKGIKNFSGLYYYYSDIVVTEDYIYGLYQVTELIRKNEHEFTSIGRTPKQIHVFTWDGEPVLRLFVEDWLNVFTVSPDNKYIYVVKSDKEDYIFKYQIPGNLL